MRRYTEAIGELIAADHLPDMLGCSLALADIQIAQGRLTDAKRTFDTGLRWTTEHPGLRGAADMHVGLSEVLIERNDLDAARRHLETSNELGESAGLPQHAYRWRVAMARLCRARGDLDGALELIEEAAPLYDTDFSPPVRPVAAMRARVQLAHGDLDAAARMGHRARTHRRRRTQLRPRVRAHHPRPRAHRHVTSPGDGAGALDDAIRLLDRLLAAAEEGSRTGSAIEILILQATAYARPRRHCDCCRGRCAGRGASARRTRGPHPPLPACRTGRDGAPAFGDVTRARHDPCRRVLAAVDLTGSSPRSVPKTQQAARSGLVDELSSRELDVLRLLRSDLSGPEIARELHVSLNTVRTHTKNIYTKLGATNRREAVRRAAELGL